MRAAIPLAAAMMEPYDTSIAHIHFFVAFTLSLTLSLGLCPPFRQRGWPLHLSPPRGLHSLLSFLVAGLLREVSPVMQNTSVKPFLKGV